MAPFYELICEEQGWAVDAALLESMKKENEEALKKLDERLKDAEENLGETEISDTLLARAEHFAKIGDKVKRGKKSTGETRSPKTSVGTS